MSWYSATDTAGVEVDQFTALALSAVWAAVGIITEQLAGLPWTVRQRDAQTGELRIVNDDVGWMLEKQPNPEMGAATWREVMLRSALIWGNGYAEIERTMDGRPIALWPIEPWRVTLTRDQLGRLAYLVMNADGRQGVLEAADVFHLRAATTDGLVGMSAVEFARRSIGLGLAAEQFASALFANGALVGGFLEFSAGVSDKARETVVADYNRRHGGAARAFKVAGLPTGTKFVPAVMEPEKAQFAELRKFQVSEVSRWFRVPPHLLGDLERATFSNIEEQGREFVGYCLRPWAIRCEEEADLKLLGPRRMNRKETVINLDELTRGRFTERVTAVGAGISAGLWTPNEGRAMFDLAPRPGGDTLLSPLNMTPAGTRGGGSSAAAPDEGELELEVEPVAAGAVENQAADAARRLMAAAAKSRQWVDRAEDSGERANRYVRAQARMRRYAESLCRPLEFMAGRAPLRLLPAVELAWRGCQESELATALADLGRAEQ